ncbi:C40 family peptidase [Allostreptomyces psammosilenae]|uniref:Cell wall-associated NlpC family hydrolase n=1 Tax=Allostreptomyces psammosilenae TaxID=1892865 RepID=A0A852ZVD2_9ACTN|nr:C40 family peptidase [Allostreptomyces psammosilenae]NYI06353.1 cell wall-associated NlpC family hydrolase [Allostreptomyces psammosilenae]
MSAAQRSSTRRSSIWRRAALRCSLVLAGAALLATAPGAVWSPALAAPDTPTAAATAPDVDAAADQAAGIDLSGLLDQLMALYEDVSAANDRYNELTDRLDRQRARVAELRAEEEEQRERVARAEEAVGALAREQYRSSGHLSELWGWISSDTPEELDAGNRLIDQAAREQANELAELQDARDALAAILAEAEASLTGVEGLTADQQEARTELLGRLDEAERMVLSLTGAQLADLQALEEARTAQAQTEFLARYPLLLRDGGRTPSDQGQAAVAYAFAQLGKPYVWGGAGPDVFDCSGLTSQAWLSAGVTIPRTSQQQWAQLPKVPVGQMRPGDLVIYYPGATHVAIYIGDGQVIHAPRPGSVIKVAPVASMHVLGAVRPDGDAPSLPEWESPEIPASATAPTGFVDVGYSTEGDRPGGTPLPPPQPAATPQPHPTGRPTAPSAGDGTGAPGSRPPSGSPSPGPTSPGSPSAGAPSPSASPSTAPSGGPSTSQSPSAPASSEPPSGDPGASASPTPSGSGSAGEPTPSDSGSAPAEGGTAPDEPDQGLLERIFG